jgi:chromosome segregation ATPase
MSRLIRENAKQLGLVRDLKQANDQLRMAEKRLREEVISLSERLRLAKTDAQRKESLARDLKDRIDDLNDETSEVREKQVEIERLRENAKKLKLEIEIKDN